MLDAITPIRYRGDETARIRDAKSGRIGKASLVGMSIAFNPADPSCPTLAVQYADVSSMTRS